MGCNGFSKGVDFQETTAGKSEHRAWSLCEETVPRSVYHQPPPRIRLSMLVDLRRDSFSQSALAAEWRL